MNARDTANASPAKAAAAEAVKNNNHQGKGTLTSVASAIGKRGRRKGPGGKRHHHHHYNHHQHLSKYNHYPNTTNSYDQRPESTTRSVNYISNSDKGYSIDTSGVTGEEEQYSPYDPCKEEHIESLESSEMMHHVDDHNNDRASVDDCEMTPYSAECDIIDLAEVDNNVECIDTNLSPNDRNHSLNYKNTSTGEDSKNKGKRIHFKDSDFFLLFPYNIIGF